MNKTMKIIIAIIAILLIGAVVVLILPTKNEEEYSNSSQTQNVTNNNFAEAMQVSSTDDLVAMVDKIYEGMQGQLPSLATDIIEVSDADVINSFTGLENGEELEYLIVSQPLMSSQAYSLVLAKVKTGVDANTVAKKMCEQVNTRRWICVEAEKVNATSAGDVVCMIMTNTDTADKIYSNFKNLAGQIGEEYTREAEEIELPEEMLTPTEVQ